MAEFTLTLKLDNDVLRAQSRDNLCIARKVAGRFTTVFQDATVMPDRPRQKPLYSTNEFKWTDKYKVFGAVDHRAGMLVQGATNTIELNFGQSSNFERGDFQPPRNAAADEFPGGDQTAANSFIARTVPGNLRPAVQCLAGGAWVTIYVDDQSHSGSFTKVLTPLNQYALFWSRSSQAESMIDGNKTAGEFTFSFPSGSTSKTVRFGYATENKQTPSESFRFYDA